MCYTDECQLGLAAYLAILASAASFVGAVVFAVVEHKGGHATKSVKTPSIPPAVDTEEEESVILDEIHEEATADDMRSFQQSTYRA